MTIFLRGDVNGDHTVDIADATSLLGYLFGEDQPPWCPDAADANDDGSLNIADPIAILTTLFGNQSVIAAPYPQLGEDPTLEDKLGPCFF